jgi:DNA topoisomerase-1
MALREFETFDSDAKAKKNIRAAIESVSSKLGNTPTICRKCYIHPEIISTYVEGSLLLEIKEEVESELRAELGSLKPEEVAVLTLLEGRLKRTLEDKLRDSVAELEPPKTGATAAKRRSPRTRAAKGAARKSEAPPAQARAAT